MSKITNYIRSTKLSSWLIGVLLVASAQNFTADAVNDFPRRDCIDCMADYGNTIDRNTIEGLTEAGLAGLIVLITASLKKSAQNNYTLRTFQADAGLPSSLIEWSEKKLNDAFDQHASDMQQIIMNELDEPVRSTVTITNISLKVYNKRIVLVVQARLLEINEDNTTQRTYLSVLQQVLEYLLLEKLSDIHERLATLHNTPEKDVDTIIHEAFKEEVALARTGVKLLRPGRRLFF